ncbi:alpha/beta fold hydrolase [Aquimarina sp. 2201CG14-23]|uniref:alpha/beta fold hydrolase n=1 Tax=Aquimarina mycalae TaxID=3040073 RepID=UPI002477F9CD|nr:alpha/beta hydrolase [Aquimarina sp. 2201CG14-23]MDH7445796.1 alpha/beta hydrolase [Aquimarina sp. 2201CG14-23]
MDITINTHRIRLSTSKKSLDPLKKTIIFLHDSLGCIELWRDFPEKIGAITNCNVVSYDRLGYGKSDSFSELKRDHDYLKKEADVLSTIIDQLGLQKVLLFGHSDGGSIALLAASLYPEKITGIITEGAHIFVEKETLQGIKDAQIAYNTTNLKQKLSKYHHKNTENVFRMWVETWLSPSFIDWNIEDYLPNIQCPSLIIHGENDEYGTIKQVETIVQKTTGKSIPLLIPDIGHTPHKEAADIVIDKTLEFVLNL